MKRIICVLLIAVSLFAAVLPASAATINDVAPCYVYISSIYARITIDESTGIATCVGEVNAKKMLPVEVVVQLQQLKNGTWQTLATWTNAGTYLAGESGSYAVASGYTYRTKVTGFIYDSDGNLVESGSGTDQVTYPAP